MALFKTFRGQRADLDKVPFTDGYAYFCPDDGSFHIDCLVDGQEQRIQLNAKNAETLTGKTLEEIINSFNLANGENKGSLQQVPDNVADGFDFTGKNYSATCLNPALTGIIEYGAIGAYSSAFGGKSHAGGKRSHTEGTTTIALGDYSHAEGNNSVTLDANSHAEGARTTARGSSSHAEGIKTLAYGQGSHAEGEETIAYGYNSHSEGRGQILWEDNNLKVEFPDSESYEKIKDTGEYTKSSLGIAYGDHSHVEGRNSLAMGEASHAEGGCNFVNGDCSHAEGYCNLVSGSASHAEGKYNVIASDYSHAEGQNNLIKSDWSHAAGTYNTIENGANYSWVAGKGNTLLSGAIYSHVTGYSNQVSGGHSTVSGSSCSANANNTFVHGISAQANHYNAFVVGYKTQSGRMSQFACGEFNVGKDNTIFEVGNGTETTPRQNAFEVYEDGLVVVGNRVQQVQNQESGVTEGYFNFVGKNPAAIAADPSLNAELKYGAVGEYSSSFGGKSTAIGKRALSEGTTTVAKGAYSHAEGNNSVTLGANSHAEGKCTVTIGENSHSEGYETIAGEFNSHAEGYKTIAKGSAAHAEGQETKAYSHQSHAEGLRTVAGDETNPEIGPYAHAEGVDTIAKGEASHAAGIGTIAAGRAQTVVGRYNIEVPDDEDGTGLLFIVGNGNGNPGSENERDIAFAVLSTGEAGTSFMGHPSLDNSLINLGQLRTLMNEQYFFPLGKGQNGVGAIVGGINSIADYKCNFTFGEGLRNTFEHQAVFGRFNDNSYWGDNKPLFMIGNGTDENNRSNAFEVREDGRVKSYVDLSKTQLEDNDLVPFGFMKQYIKDNFATLLEEYFANNQVTFDGGDAGSHEPIAIVGETTLV